MKRLVAAALTAALLISVSAKAQDSAHADLPDSVALVAEVRNPAALSKQVNSLSTAVSGRQVPGKMLFRPLKRVLKLDKPVKQVVDMEHPLRLVVFNPPRHAAPVLLVGVSDAQAYVDSHAQEAKKGSDGIYTLDQPMKAVGTIGNLLVMSRRKKATAHAVQSLQGTSLSKEKPLYDGGSITVEAQPSGILASLDEMPVNPLEMLKKKMKKQMKGEQAEMNLANLKALESIGRQVESVVDTVSVNKNGVQMECVVTAAKESDLSGYFSRVGSASPRSLDYLPADAVVAFGGRVGDLSAIAEWQGQMMQRVLQASGADESNIDKAVSFTRKLAGTLGEEVGIACLISKDGRLRTVETVEVTDPEKYRDLYPQMVQMARMMADMQPEGGKAKMNVQRDALSHGGQSIDRWNVTFDMPVPKNLPAEQAQRVRQVQNMITQLFMGGSESTIYSTFFDKNVVLTLGQDPLGLLKDIIDGTQKSLSESSQFTDRAQKLAPNYSGAGYLSITGLLKGALRMIHNSDINLPVPVKPGDLQFPASPGVAMAYNCSGRTSRLKIDLPRKEMKALNAGIQGAFMKVMQRAQKRQQQQMQQ